jgi:hypothetical protein
MFKGGIADEEIARRLGRRVKTIADWRRAIRKAVVVETIQASLDDAEEYRRMMWFWTVEITRLQNEIHANPLIQVTKILTDKKTGEQTEIIVMEMNMPLVNALSHAIGERTYWTQLWTPTQVAGAKAAIARETDTGGGVRVQFVFPNMEAVTDYYARIRSRRQLVPPLQLMPGRESTDDDNVLAEVDAFNAEYGKDMKLPEETL